MLVLHLASASLACSLAGPERHTVDEAEAAVDNTPPAAPSVEVLAVSRGTGGTASLGADGRCYVSSTSCDDLGFVSLRLTWGGDDRTGAAEGGWIVEVSGAEAPSGYPAPGVRARDGALSLSWIDGATDAQEPIDWAVRVVAVDQAGNRAEPVEVRITDPGREAGPAPCAEAAGGCATTPGRGAWWLGLLALQSGRRRRSSRDERRPGA